MTNQHLIFCRLPTLHNNADLAICEHQWATRQQRGKIWCLLNLAKRLKHKWRISQRGIEFIPAELTFLSQLYFNGDICYGEKSVTNLCSAKKYLHMIKGRNKPYCTCEIISLLMFDSVFIMWGLSCYTFQLLRVIRIIHVPSNQATLSSSETLADITKTTIHSLFTVDSQSSLHHGHYCSLKWLFLNPKQVVSCISVQSNIHHSCVSFLNNCSFSNSD